MSRVRRLLRSFRSRLVLTIVLSALVAVGVGIAVPVLARTRAEAAIATRLGDGAHVTIGDAHVGLLTTLFDDVAITIDGSEAHLARVTVRASVFGLATSGSSAVTDVTIEGGRADVELASLVSRSRRVSESESGSEEASTGAHRVIAVRGIAFIVRIGADEVASVGAANLRWDGVMLAVRAEDVALGAESFDHVEVDVVRGDGVARLARIALGHVVVSADAVSGEGATSRIVGVVRRERESDHESESEHESESGSFSRWVDGLERHLDPSFVASVDDLTVRRTIEGTPHDVIDGLRASFRRTSLDAYATEGEGQPEGGGSLSWSLDLAPHAPSASGTLTFDRVAFAALVPFLPASIPFSEPERAHVSGHLVLATGGTQVVHAEGTLAVEDLALAHPRIDAEPVRHIAFSLRGAADLTPSTHRLEVSSLGLTMGAAQASLAGTIEWAEDHYLIEGRAALPRTRCDDAVHAIPGDLLGDTASFRLSGDIAASLEAHIDSRDLPHTTLHIQVANACTFTSWPASADTARFAGSFEHRVVEPDGATFEMTTGPGTDAWTPISEISPFLVHAVLAHEDAGFFVHAGFAPWAIREALIRDLTAGRYVAGGSTITMQLVKNVFLHREKTLARKIQEVLLTWWVETRMDKERILELYLNVIEYGPNVYGIRHASEHYFGRSPADLSPAESAYLALILPNPPAFHEQYERGEIPRAFRNRIASFVRVCGTRGRYDAAAVAYGVAEADTLAFHREGDPPPAPRTTEGAVASIPQIQFFSTVPLARLAADETETDDVSADDTSSDEGWNDDAAWEP